MVLLDGVTRVLPRLGQHFQLILLTKGDHEVQKSKLERSGLATYFAGVHIVPEKDAEVLRGLMDEYSLHPARTWMVGNSPRSDINPALEVGIGAVHIPHTLTWTLEDEAITDLKRVVALDSFEELEDLFFETNDRIKAVIFDWGGVLQTLPDEAYRAEWERRLGLVPGALASMFRELQRPLILGEIGNDEYIQQVADRLGFSSVEVAERFTDHFYSVVRLNSDVLAAVKKLRETYRVALLTNAWPDADKLFLKKQGIDVRAEFDVYVNSAEVGLAKPDPAIYWLTLERLDVRPQEAVFLDDNPRNVEAARALGIQTIHVTDVPKALVELEALLQSCNLTVALSQ
jgi:epoxide hydrolase-like predicted phosphatase